MNVNEVKRTILSGNKAADQAKRTLEQVAAEAADIERLAQLTLHDSRANDAGKALRILEGMDDELVRTARRVDAAIEHADAYLASLG